ncbi:hypothetical protein ONR57_13495 [Hoyosella sp. YIM 151337]|uniref:hypothetical protein n=1 Tax=Hoyosella sp. YIM 151337 TaxID=2992742 RepID=UPI002235688A|nr:hypothetical protein [Hoyosella sp. YIM 151337]MCW4354316.1 hypothetical protein [Hoyosella sp. YIM 151337]
MRFSSRRAVTFAACLLAFGTVACTTGTDELASADATTTTAHAPESTVEATADAPEPQAPEPHAPEPQAPEPEVPVPPANSAAQSGTVIVESKTLTGAPVPGMPVTIRRASACNPESRDIPLDITYTHTFEGVTDHRGQASFTGIPIGCYGAQATPPEGSYPVPEGMHSVFLTKESPADTVWFRFYDEDPGIN